jgi:hypothetical protein
VKEEPCNAAILQYGHLEGIYDDLGCHIVPDRPSHHLAVPQVDDDTSFLLNNLCLYFYKNSFTP